MLSLALSDKRFTQLSCATEHLDRPGGGPNPSGLSPPSHYFRLAAISVAGCYSAKSVSKQSHSNPALMPFRAGRDHPRSASERLGIAVPGQ